jgi:D-beta-D-heptose 7-phosphate kinase/D-beta-D-heptose 1-phosphate adenosyltransferase
MDNSELAEFVKKFNGKKVAVVGDIALDSYLFGKVNRVNPERPGYPLLTVEKEEYRLGCAANVAMNLSSLGAEVSLYGWIGEDEKGKVIWEECQKNRIRLVCVKRDKTITKQRWIESNHNDYLGRADFGEEKIEAINEKQSEELFDNLTKNGFEAIVLSDYNKGIFKGNFSRRIIDWANSHGILTVVDPKPVNALLFSGASLIRPNLSEAQAIIGEKEMDLALLAKKLKEKVQSKEVVITCGNQGIVVDDGGFHHIKTKARQVVDVTGAGDTVAATLTLSLLSGANLIESAQIANYAAGIVVEKQGTATVNSEELIKRVEEEENA